MKNIKLQANKGTISEVNLDLSKMKVIENDGLAMVLDDMDNYGGCILVCKGLNQDYYVNFYPDQDTALAGYQRYKKTGSPYANGKPINSEYSFRKV